MGTALIGVILILGVMGCIGTAVDTYAPEHSDDQQYLKEAYNYLQEVGTIDDIKKDSTLVDVINIIIENAMAFVMNITAIMLVCFYYNIVTTEPKKTLRVYLPSHFF